MEHRPHNPNCALSGTKYCRLMNMRCENCGVASGQIDAGQVREDLETYLTLLPEGGISQLFTDNACQFCKGAHRRARTGFAIVDMAHPEPRRIQRWLLGKRVSTVGTMIPVQMSVCTHCRRRLLWIEYLPLAVPLAVGLVGLGLMAVDALRDPLERISLAMPFILWAAAVLIGALAGKLAAKRLKSRSAETMYTDALTHPALAAMVQKGWSAVLKGAKPIFSKTRLSRGLGTAVDGEWDEEDEPAPQTEND